MSFPLSVYLSYYEDLPAKQAVQLMAEAGFTHAEMSEDHLYELMQQPDPIAAAKEFREFLNHCGMTISQGHLSFGNGMWICSDDTVEKLKAELEVFSIVGIKNAVLHANGGNDLGPALRFARAAENIKKLAQHAETFGIIICLENLMTSEHLRTAEDLIRLIQAAGDKNLGICLDTGHLHLCNKQGWAQQTQGDFIRTAGKYLQALHVVDNNGLGDTHQMPYSARYGINWKEVLTALKDINYPGIFNVECVGERYAPLYIRRIKLDYIHKMCAYMVSDRFLQD